MSSDGRCTYFSGCIVKRGITESQISVYLALETTDSFPNWSYILCSHQQLMRVNLVALDLDICHLVNFSRSGVYLVVSRCDFNFYFPDE